MNQSQSLSLVNREKLSQLSKIELVGIILAQQKVLEQLEKEIEKLKISRDLDSQTSSKPPSTDLLKKPEQVKIDPEKNSSSLTKRKPGGQPGHQGQTRKGFSRTDRIEILQPIKCSNCGQRKFLAQPVKVDSQQVAQLVEQPIEVVEYHRYHCQCSECGTVTSAEWSPKMIPGQDLSVKLQAFLGWLGNYGHLPYEKQQEMLWELGQIEIGLGTLVNTNQRIDRAVAPSVNSLKNWIQETQPNIHADETPWAVKGVKEWLWIVANRDFALFQAADTRSRAELETLLGLSYDGVLSSDDYSVYNGYDVKAQQKCLAHLRRHFKKLIRPLAKIFLVRAC